VSIQARNNVTVRGQGPATLVFAHGFGCDQTMWRRLVPTFESRFRIVSYDLVGSGGSDLSVYDKQKYGSLDGHAADLLEIVGEFGRGPVVIVSHSVSAMISLLASVAKPSLFTAHVMVGPSPCYISEGDYTGGFSRSDIDDLLETLEENYLGWSSTMAPAIMGAPHEPELGIELTNSFCRTDPDIAKHFARVTFLSDQRRDLLKNTTPTLILQSTNDLIAPVAVGEYMSRVMPHSQLKMIKNIGHCPHMSEPELSLASIEAFLQALPV
jgi:sigma-B regulation protein RsbQ